MLAWDYWPRMLGSRPIELAPDLGGQDSRLDLFGFGVKGLELPENPEGVVGATGAEPQANGYPMRQPRPARQSAGERWFAWQWPSQIVQVAESNCLFVHMDYG
jgi:hypothetical protein